LGRLLGRQGGYFITLPHNVLDRLKAARGPGGSYSDVILRPATAQLHRAPQQIRPTKQGSPAELFV
jgi:hypothetical protein